MASMGTPERGASEVAQSMFIGRLMRGHQGRGHRERPGGRDDLGADAVDVEALVLRGDGGALDQAEADAVAPALGAGVA